MMGRRRFGVEISSATVGTVSAAPARGIGFAPSLETAIGLETEMTGARTFRFAFGGLAALDAAPTTPLAVGMVAEEGASSYGGWDWIGSTADLSSNGAARSNLVADGVGFGA